MRGVHAAGGGGHVLLNAVASAGLGPGEEEEELQTSNHGHAEHASAWAPLLGMDRMLHGCMEPSLTFGAGRCMAPPRSPQAPDDRA